MSTCVCMCTNGDIHVRIHQRNNMSDQTNRQFEQTVFQTNCVRRFPIPAYDINVSETMVNIRFIVVDNLYVWNEHVSIEHATCTPKTLRLLRSVRIDGCGETRKNKTNLHDGLSQMGWQIAHHVKLWIFFTSDSRHWKDELISLWCFENLKGN